MRCPCVLPGNSTFRMVNHMPDIASQEQTYRVGNINFIVTPVYRTGQGDTIFSILLKLMKADTGRI